MPYSSLSLLKKPELAFGGQTFFAKQHKVDTCGSNGLPLTPNSITILGRAQLLKTLKHPYLCKYLDLIRGKHERIIVVSQYCGQPLTNYVDKDTLNNGSIIRICRQALTALNELHSRNIVHRNLSSENILVQDDGSIKLHNYGLYHMTDNGRLVAFPIIQFSYTSPEVYLQGPDEFFSNIKGDIWSLGIIIAELLLGKTFWKNLKVGQIIRKVVSLVQCNSSVFEKIANEHNCLEIYQNLNSDLKQFVEDCLNIMPDKRPDTNELLKCSIFDVSGNDGEDNGSKIENSDIFTINEFYHWWQLVGGDVLQELKKQGLIRSSPPILSLPSLVLIDGTILGQERNPATLYDPRIVQMPLVSLYERFQHIPLSLFYPLVHTKSVVISRCEPDTYDASGLPLVIKEKDPEYQLHRVILLRRLLKGFPFTRDIILTEARKDIPPLLRGDIWAAILNLSCDYHREYRKLDKESPTATDRQIDVDIPRCHQYNELLSSSEGHKKLKRILKAWVFKHTQYVYWQGLDSLTAPFLYLNFNDEAKAFGCLCAFVPKYLHKFFLKDNSAVIQEYLAKFSQLIAFHDPTLANHLHNISFIPELFAIPWFLTMFSHVFPLHKILHLWDWLLLCDSSFPLHIGLSVLTQLRSRLLSSGFNECILLFSDLPEVDIENSVNLSLATYESTPSSITTRNFQNKDYYPDNQTEFDIREVLLKDLNRERCSRISAADLVLLIKNTPDKLLVIDIRNPIQFGRMAVVDSINIPFSIVKFGETTLDSLGSYSTLIKESFGKNVVIIGTEDTDLELFPKFLLHCDVPRVCVLHGGFNVLISITPTILSSHNNIHT